MFVTVKSEKKRNGWKWFYQFACDGVWAMCACADGIYVLFVVPGATGCATRYAVNRHPHELPRGVVLL